MSDAMLTFERSGPDPVADGGTVVVLLHGRGSDRADLQGLRTRLPPTWPLLTPQAPFPGEPWGYGPGWAWYKYAAGDRLEERAFEESLAHLDAFLDGIPEILGARPRRVVLGGFSQGGTTSLAYGLSRPARVAAVLNFSGFLADAAVVGAGLMARGGPPVFWGHGLHDPAIPHALAVKGRARLEAARVRVTARDYPIGHWIDAGEVLDAVSFLGST
jgi:phospholipase/carboxylesterase